MPIAAMLLAVLCWGSALVGNKVLLAAVSVSEVLLVRMVIAGAILWLVVAARRELAQVARIGRRPWLMGLLEPGMTGLLVIWGISYTQATHAAVLWAVAPLVVPVLARLTLGEALRPAVVAGALLALVGTTLLVGGGAATGASSLVGDLLCLAGVMCSCFNAVLARAAAATHGRALPTTAVQMLVSAILALAVLTIIERPAVSAAAWTPHILIVAAYLGAAGSAAPFLLYNYALRHLPAARTSLFGPLVAPVGATVAALWLDEPLGAHVFWAIAILLVAAFLPTVVDRWRRG